MTTKCLLEHDTVPVEYQAAAPIDHDPYNYRNMTCIGEGVIYSYNDIYHNYVRWIGRERFCFYV